MILSTPLRHVPLRIAGVLAFVLASSAALSGCSPAPTPAPTPTAAFASEEDAFAAAEDTYREFTTRLNQIVISDPGTFEPLFELSSGEFEKADRKAYSSMHANRLEVDGETKIVSFRGVSAEPSFSTVTAAVCLDVRAVTITDAAGASQVSPNRPDIYALTVTFVADGQTLLIDSATVSKDSECVAPL